MKVLRTILICALLSLSFAAKGEELLAYRDCVTKGYDFLLYVPDSYSDTDEGLPVVIYLHGKSLTGNDLNMVTKYGSITAVRRGVDINALVIAPQCQTYSGWEADRVMAVVDYVIERYNVDENRIYVIGMSMGGSGTYRVAAAYPDRIAAAITMCGSCWVDVEPLTKVPLWILHGTKDTATPFSRSTDAVEKMRKISGISRLRYTWLEGCNHSILARVFLMQEVYDWMFSHSLDDPGRPVCRDYEVTPDDLNNIYKHLSGNTQKSLPIQRP